MRVLLTGASSFTGMWLVLALARRGVEVVAALQGDPRRYDALRQARMIQVATHAAVLPEAPMGSPALLDAAARLGPFDVLVLHGARVGEFKDAAYDAGKAVIANTAGLERLLVRLKNQGLRRVVATGSVFEANEGRGTPPRHPVGAYGLAKSLTWEILKEAAEREELPLAKFVIASPFGPFEKPGLVQDLIMAWLKGEPGLVRRPQLGRDWIPAELLAEAHADLVAALPPHKPLVKRTPSLFPLTNGAFAQMLADEMRRRLKRPCRVRLLEPPEASDEPLERYGLERLDAANDPPVRATCFERLAGWYVQKRQSSSILSLTS